MSGCSSDQTAYVAGTTLASTNYFGGRFAPRMAIDGNIHILQPVHSSIPIIYTWHAQIGWDNIMIMGGAMQGETTNTIMGDIWAVGYCTAGSVKTINYPSSYSCTPCTAGTYAAEGLTACSECAMNTWSSSSAGSCTPCPTNSSSPAGAETCTCLIGYEGDGHSTTACSQCSLGRYRNGAMYTSGETSCVNCAAGTYAATLGSTSCVACPLHSTQSKEGASSCVCEAGYGGDGTSDCSQCGTGSYRNSSMVNAGTTLCELCSIGRYQSSTGATLCVACSLGTYTNAMRTTLCDSCSLGRYQSTFGTLQIHTH
jgi:hypothetical protein